MDIPGTGADAIAVKRLWDEHAGPLWRYVCRLTGDPAHAEDVVQETLLRAWQRPHVLNNGQSPRAWLFTVARNMVIDDRRSARFRNELISRDGAGPADDAPRPAAGPGAAADPATLDVSGHAAQLADLLAAIDERRAPAVDGEAGRAALEIVCAVYESSRLGRTVTLRS